jgi:hypothetical protein
MNNVPSCPSDPPFSLVLSFLEAIPSLRAFHLAGGKDESYLHHQL